MSIFIFIVNDSVVRMSIDLYANICQYMSFYKFSTKTSEKQLIWNIFFGILIANKGLINHIEIYLFLGYYINYIIFNKFLKV